jgi:hypothetical protein
LLSKKEEMGKKRILMVAQAESAKW